MDMNNPPNQSYWFVLREDQSNVILSTNNFVNQNPQIPLQETRYVVETGENRQFIHINEPPIIVQEHDSQPREKDCSTTKDVFWDRSKIRLLLKLCLEDRFKNINKQKTLWHDIASHVGTTADECCKKYRNLRRTYIRLLKKNRLGKEIKWVHYNTCEEVFKECKSLPSSFLETWDDQKVRKLLLLYIENLHRLRSSTCLQKDIWKEIALEIGTTEYNCYHKFKNMKRAYLNWLERSKDTGKPIKWPYHHFFERIYYNSNPNTGPWNRTKIRLLLDAYIERLNKFRNPRYLKKELWKEISETVGENPPDCEKKFRNLKQTYIRIRSKVESGLAVTKWRYYKDFEEIYGHQTYCTTNNVKLVYKPNRDDYVRQLLLFYIENVDKFRDPLIKKRTLWKKLSPQILLSPDECDRKFRNLKQTYIRLIERKRETGKNTKWPYFSYFEKIFDVPNQNARSVDNLTIHEIKRVVQEMQDVRDTSKFDKLVQSMEESNMIQRERNKILLALLNRN